MIQTFKNYQEKHPSFVSFDMNNVQASSMVVIIPVFMEDKVRETLDSLCACQHFEGNVSVFLIVNASEKAEGDIIAYQEKSYHNLSKYISSHPQISVYTIKAFDLPKKHFGAGLARKIGMDLAVQHFMQTDNEGGVVVSLDADSLVAENYLSSIQQFFSKEKHKACSIYFEHPLEGEEFDEEIYNAITQYELHLRYYVESLKFIGFPYAVHTVGSCFAFKALAYVKVGGMNRRQGGEEFYFIQKLVQQGGYGDLNDTCVYPSPRISTRVPFGTGPSIKKLLDEGTEYLTYNLQSFIDLKELFDQLDNYYQISEEDYQSEILNLPGRVRSFLLNSAFYEELKPVMDNCGSLEVFRKRFYHVFNAFKLVKYINYTHEYFLEKTSIFDAAIELLELKEVDTDDLFEDKELLLAYRKIQKQQQ